MMNNDPTGTRRARPAPTRRWLRILAINFVVGATVAAVMALGGRASTSTVVIALVYANLIGVTAALLLPPLMRRLDEHGGGSPWFVLPTALLGLAAVGALVIGLGAVGFGVFPAGQLWRVIWPSLGIAAVTTLGLGVGIALHESTQAHRAQATLAWQEAELARIGAERLATEARLASLEAHLRPHFLYNTLNTIGAMIPNGAERAHGLLCDLAALLRFSLDRRGRRMVPLADELEVVKAYLAIQQARFKRLTCVIDVPPELKRCEVPPFVLLPVVENCVIHVVQDRPAVTSLWIRARADGDTLELVVWDDGPGFSLKAIVSGHGLDILRGRLEALYGAAARFSVDQREEGAMVSIRVPMRDEGQS